MRVIGESKTVDLSKKLTVEMTRKELAIIFTSLSAITTGRYNEELPNAVKSELVTELTADIDGPDYPYDAYKEVRAILVTEGVAE